MSWRMVGLGISTAEMAAIAISQKATVNKNIYLRATRAGVIQYNNPAWTSLVMRIYSDKSGSPGKLLFTSATSHTKASLFTLDHGYKETYFEFNYAPLQKNTPYHFVLYASGYIGDASAHLAWRQSYPDPIYRNGFTPEAANGDNHPFDLMLLGTDVV